MASPIITPMPVQTDTNYSPISRMAVIGLLLALPSMLIFASESLFWLLLVVTLPAFIMCCLAWRSIRSSQGNLAGETWAVLGIVITVGSGLGWLTMNVVSKYITESEAKDATTAWIATLQKGEAGASFLMRMPPSARVLDFNPEEHARLRKQFPGQQQEQSEFEKHLADDVCGQLLRYGDKVNVKYAGLVEAKSVREAPVFRFGYYYDSPAKQGFFVVSARGEEYNSADGVRRDWVLSIDPTSHLSDDTPYGQQLRIHTIRATRAVESLIYAIANTDDTEEIKKLVDSKNQGELQTIVGYIRPKGKVGAISPIEIRKPMRLHTDKKTDNILRMTFDCTTIVEKDRAIDFSVEYVVDVTKPENAILQNCHFLATRKMIKPVPVASERPDPLQK